jgi:hypothetical protein
MFNIHDIFDVFSIFNYIHVLLNTKALFQQSLRFIHGRRTASVAIGHESLIVGVSSHSGCL